MSRAPYKYLDYYTFEDADLFFGREEETQRMVGEILSTRLLVLFSPSGSGKTSLINAGVRPQLENMGYQTIYTRLETEPISSVCNAVASALEIPCDGNVQSLYEFLKAVISRTDKPLVIFLDQFEEFFTVFREQHDKRKEFIDQLAKIKYDDQLPVFIVLSLREDYFVNLHEFRDAIPSIFQNNANLRLEPFTDEEARRAIVNPLQAKDIHASIEAVLVNELINDLKDSQPGIEPIKLQIVCYTLWEKKPKGEDQITLSDYQACEGADAILSHHVQDLLNKIPKRQHGFMVRIFEALKTEENTKRFRSFGELQKELKIKKAERLAKILDELVDLHIFRYEEMLGIKWYEFKHDYLVGMIMQWVQRRKDQLAKKRLRYAIAPGIILAFALLTWAIIEFNRFEARFTLPEYDRQMKEVLVKRKFNPFGFQVTTGIFDDDLKNLDARNRIDKGFIISFAQKNDWIQLAEILKPVSSGNFLCHLGEFYAGIDTLISAMNDQDWDVRSQAAAALGNLGKADDRVIDTLVATLKDQDSYDTAQAAYALGNIGRADDRAIAALVAALEYQNSYVVAALGNLGKADDRVIDALVAALNDKQAFVRSEAISALGNLGKADDRVIDALVTALKDQDRNVRSKAADALGNLGNANDRVIDALVTALKDEAWDAGDVRSREARALGNLGKADDRVIDALVSELKSYYVRDREAAAYALGNISRADGRVIDALVATLKDQDSYVRSIAKRALGNLGQTNDRAISALAAELKYSSDQARNTAYALGNIGRDNDLAIAALVAALGDNDSEVRSQAAGALRSLLKSKNEKELIDKFLKNDLSGYRTAGAQALARQDSIGDEILNEINQLKDKDKRPWVRLGAWEAYELIQKRLADEKAANQFIHKADSLVQINKFWEAENQYQSAFDQLKKIIRVDSLKIARTKFQQARCTARMKRLIPALDHLEIAFQYNKAWRDTLRAEREQKGSEWEFMKENWYLNDVLLKK